MTKEKYLLLYLLKFLGCFCVLYFGTKAVIGLSAPGGYYSSFISNWLDYISLLRVSLLHGAKSLLFIAGYATRITNVYYLTMVNGRGIHMVYSCLGYGIMSFWIAFIYANKGSFKRKSLWIVAGIIFIWLLNVTRISMLLLAVNRRWNFPFGLDHHTWFNIVSYLFIFAGIYFYDRSQRVKEVERKDNGRP